MATKTPILNVRISETEDADLTALARGSSLSKTSIVRLALAQLMKSRPDVPHILMSNGEFQTLITDPDTGQPTRRK